MTQSVGKTTVMFQRSFFIVARNKKRRKTLYLLAALQTPRVHEALSSPTTRQPMPSLPNELLHHHPNTRSAAMKTRFT